MTCMALSLEVGEGPREEAAAEAAAPGGRKETADDRAPLRSPLVRPFTSLSALGTRCPAAAVDPSHSAWSLQATVCAEQLLQ